ncbi:MAG: MarR family winged helix-turn-helix transcriptional regulator [bacterium]
MKQNDQIEDGHQAPRTIHEMSLFISRIFNREMKELGLTQTQWTVLYQLYLGGEQTQTDLANALSTTKPPLGKVIDKLEQTGWVHRRQNPEDRRQNLVSLTDKVSPLIDRLERIVANIAEIAMVDFSQEQRAQFISYLSASHTNLLNALNDT